MFSIKPLGPAMDQTTAETCLEYERMFAAYEAEISRLKKENRRLSKLVDAVFKPEVRIYKSDLQQFLVSEDELPSVKQESGPSVDQEKPKPLTIKEEEEDFWSIHEGDHLQGLEETADSTNLPFSVVVVKNEIDDVNASSSQFHQTQTKEEREAESPASTSVKQIKLEPDDGEDYGLLEPASTLDIDFEFEPISDEQLSSDGCETEDSDDCQTNSKESQSGLDTTENSEVNFERFEKNPTSCSVCSRGFSPKQSMEVQMGTHTGQKPFPCLVCGNGFSQRGSQQSHVRTNTEEKPFACSVCGQDFSHKKALQMHKRTHTGEKLFSCSVCGKLFSQRGNMQSHMRTHTGEKPFPCSMCDKKFSQKQHVKIHMRTHTGEKPFSCSFCGREFSHKKAMQMHMRIHTGEKPFPCSVCGKTFSRRDNVQLHMRTHTGEKPFPCSVCGKKFSYKQHMNIHMRTHTGEKPFSCSFCGKKFSKRYNVAIHERTHRRETPHDGHGMES